jgi:hypothetical protein
VKPVNLNQLLFHSRSHCLSFFLPPLKGGVDFDSFFADVLTQLQVQELDELARHVDKYRTQIKKILKTHPDQSHGFFFSAKLQGYIVLESGGEAFCVIGSSFYVRPLLEELFVNPEYMIVNLSLYDVSIYRGDFHHVEIVQHFDFEEMPELKLRVFAPNQIGLIPYKNILALKSLAAKVMDLAQYQGLPVIITGLDDLKEIFLRNVPPSVGVISHFHEDFFENTCTQILEKCRNYRYAIMDFYSARLKEQIIKMVKSKKMISDLGLIIEAAHKGRVIQLVLPTEKKLWGKINFETGEYELHKKPTKKQTSVDILNELAELVVRQGGKIKILGPHFFPQESHVLAVLRGHL